MGTQSKMRNGEGQKTRSAKVGKSLGDIGNLVTVQGMNPKPDRPITRSFGAQLLANAQAAAAAENNNKLVAEANDVVASGKKAGLAPKPIQKKQQKSVTVIETSPDSDSEVNKSESKKEGEEVSSKTKQKSTRTLTSVLTARSKAKN